MKFLRGFQSPVARSIFSLLLGGGVLITVCVFFGLAFLDISRSVGIKMIRSVTGYFFMYYLYQTVFLYMSLSELLSDMRQVIDSESGDGEFFKSVKTQLPQIRSRRNRLITLGVVLCTLFALPTLNGEWLYHWTYFMPVAFLLQYGYSFVHFVSRRKTNSQLTVAADDGREGEGV
mmetsp:Transcript_7532/g.9064  ORF Transcript_7532/g.9064 Transcript_7532/m.9064 type:complete len:175 (+) Transcript_7532:3054-3578(+)